MLDHDLTIRAATPRDADALDRLASLDDRSRRSGRALLAERDGPLSSLLARRAPRPAAAS